MPVSKKNLESVCVHISNKHLQFSRHYHHFLQTCPRLPHKGGSLVWVMFEKCRRELGSSRSILETLLYILIERSTVHGNYGVTPWTMPSSSNVIRRRAHQKRAGLRFRSHGQQKHKTVINSNTSPTPLATPGPRPSHHVCLLQSPAHLRVPSCRADNYTAQRRFFETEVKNCASTRWLSCIHIFSGGSLPSKLNPTGACFLYVRAAEYNDYTVLYRTHIPKDPLYDKGGHV